HVPWSSLTAVVPPGAPAGMAVHVAPGMARCCASVAVMRSDGVERGGTGCCANEEEQNPLSNTSTAAAAKGEANLSTERTTLLYGTGRGIECTLSVILRNPQCDLLLTNAVVLTMDAAFTIHRRGAVAVTGDSIVAVGAAPLGYDAGETIDCGG